MEDFEDSYSRYTEFLEQYAEHPEWFDFDGDKFTPQLPGRKTSPAWNGKPGIDIYQNMSDNYINNNSNN